MTNFLDQFDPHVLLFAIISLGKAHSEKSTTKEQTGYRIASVN